MIEEKLKELNATLRIPDKGYIWYIAHDLGQWHAYRQTSATIVGPIWETLKFDNILDLLDTIQERTKA